MRTSPARAVGRGVGEPVSDGVAAAVDAGDTVALADASDAAGEAATGDAVHPTRDAASATSRSARVTSYACSVTTGARRNRPRRKASTSCSSETRSRYAEMTYTRTPNAVA